MKCGLMAWGQLEEGFEVLALGEICFEGMRGVETGLEVLVPGEMCFAGMEADEKGVSGVGTW